MNLRKTLFILPNLFTLSSVCCGLYAIVVSLGPEPQFLRASIAIIFAMLFDMLDGRVARLTKTQSAFGVQMDSLADVVSFGVAPALLAYAFALQNVGNFTIDVGLVVAFVYVSCGAIRLARFNVTAGRPTKTKGFFEGLPIPLAAGVIAALVIARGQPGIGSVVTTPLFLVVMPALSLLMVSSIPYRNFKNLRLNRRTLLAILVLVVSSLALSVFLSPTHTLLILFAFYLVMGPVDMAFRIHKRVVAYRRSRRERASQSTDK